VTRWFVLIAGCTGAAKPDVGAPVAAAPEAFGCPDGTTLTVEPPGTGIARTVPDTEVQTCRDPAGNLVGPQLERWTGGGVAAEGAWAAGTRDGVWTTWFPDGAFRSRTSWRAGVQHGPRLEIAWDGRIVEIEMIDGRADGIRSLAAGSPMPEWEGGARVEGTRYRGHLGSGIALAP
jgi:hypothetical protein